MEKATVLQLYRSLQTDMLRLAKIGLTDEADGISKVMEGMSKKSGFAIPNFYKNEIHADCEMLRAAYKMSGRTDGMISKREIRDYVKRGLGKSEQLATRYITDKPGCFLYRALLFQLLKPVEEGELWKLTTGA